MKTLSMILLGFALTNTPVTAGEVVVLVEGQVTSTLGNGLGSGPFAGAQVGDPVVFITELLLAPNVPPMVSLFDISPVRTRLEIGNLSSLMNVPSPAQFVVGNDVSFPSFPTVDYLVGFVDFPFGNTLEFLVEDPQGTLLQSTDLSTQSGTFGIGANSHLSLTEAGGLDGIRIDLVALQLDLIGPVGSAYCSPPVANSVGLSSLLAAHGSEVVAAQHVKLLALQLPPDQFALVLASNAAGLVPNPAGSQGNLCLGGSIGRYTSQVQFTGPFGGFLFDLDLGSIPSPTGPVMAQAGQTLYFQVWHRDMNPSQTTNLTNGLALSLR